MVTGRKADLREEIVDLTRKEAVGREHLAAVHERRGRAFEHHLNDGEQQQCPGARENVIAELPHEPAPELAVPPAAGRPSRTIDGLVRTQ